MIIRTFEVSNFLYLYICFELTVERTYTLHIAKKLIAKGLRTQYKTHVLRNSAILDYRTWHPTLVSCDLVYNTSLTDHKEPYKSK